MGRGVAVPRPRSLHNLAFTVVVVAVLEAVGASAAVSPQDLNQRRGAEASHVKDGVDTTAAVGAIAPASVDTMATTPTPSSEVPEEEPEGLEGMPVWLQNIYLFLQRSFDTHTRCLRAAETQFLLLLCALGVSGKRLGGAAEEMRAAGGEPEIKQLRLAVFAYGLLLAVMTVALYVLHRLEILSHSWDISLGMIVFCLNFGYVFPVLVFRSKQA